MAGERKGQPPPELRAIWNIDRLGMPNGGGWYDLPAGLIRRGTVARNVFDSFRAYESARGNIVDWTNRHPELWFTITAVKQARMNNVGK